MIMTNFGFLGLVELAGGFREIQFSDASSQRKQGRGGEFAAKCRGPRFNKPVVAHPLRTRVTRCTYQTLQNHDSHHPFSKIGS